MACVAKDGPAVRVGIDSSGLKATDNDTRMGSPQDKGQFPVGGHDPRIGVRCGGASISRLFVHRLLAGLPQDHGVEMVGVFYAVRNRPYAPTPSGEGDTGRAEGMAREQFGMGTALPGKANARKVFEVASGVRLTCLHCASDGLLVHPSKGGTP